MAASTDHPYRTYGRKLSGDYTQKPAVSTKDSWWTRPEMADRAKFSEEWRQREHDATKDTK